MNNNKYNDGLDEVLELICDQIEIIGNKKELDPVSLQNLGELLDQKKDILEIRKKETELNGSINTSGYSGYTPNHGYSGERGYRIQPYYFVDEGIYGNSYAGSPMYRGRPNYTPYNTGYSWNDAESDLIHKLKELASNSTSEKANAIHNFISQLEQM